MRVLVTAASRHGSTAEIAEAIATGLSRRGADAEAIPIDDVKGLEGFDAVVLGSAIYMGRWLKPARKFADDHARELSQRPVWLFSSGPLGDREHLVPEVESTDPAQIVELTHAREHRVFAGRLDRAGLSLVERAAVRAVHAPEADSRDWGAVDEFAAAIAEGLS